MKTRKGEREGGEVVLTCFNAFNAGCFTYSFSHSKLEARIFAAGVVTFSQYTLKMGPKHH